MNVLIVNPLEVALAHYQFELQNVLRDLDVDVSAEAAMEPGHSGESRSRWVWATWRMMWVARSFSKRANRSVILVWPPLGYFDVFIAGLLMGKRVAVVIHDPEPLVKAVGYGKFWRWVVRCACRARLIVHSDSALAVLESQGLERRAVKMPHPISRPDDVANAGDGSRRVLVFGQYKADRDVGLLAKLPRLLPDDLTLEIRGRGWPEVRGWQVFNEFVDEQEVPRLLAESSVVVIPYSRFFQSGVAVRALECGTPVVGPAGSSLEEIFGAGSALLAPAGDADEWARSIRAATTMSSDDVARLASDYRANCNEVWGVWLAAQ